MQSGSVKPGTVIYLEYVEGLDSSLFIRQRASPVLLLKQGLARRVLAPFAAQPRQRQALLSRGAPSGERTCAACCRAGPAESVARPSSTGLAGHSRRSLPSRPRRETAAAPIARRASGDLRMFCVRVRSPC